MKIIYFAIIILFTGVIIALILPGYHSRDLNSAARAAKKNIILFSGNYFFRCTTAEREDEFMHISLLPI